MMPRIRFRNRMAALLAGTMVLAPFALPNAPALCATAAGFDAPDGTLILTRELRRSLAPGKDIVSRRSYQIHFVREGSGWRVEGTLAKTEVEAPEELAMLAVLEKARKDEGLFPLSLDEQGMIIAQRGASDSTTAQTARSSVLATVEKIGMSGSDEAVATNLVQRIASQSSAVGGNWPTDLFRPSATARKQVREVPLPDGKQGRVTVTMKAEPDPRGFLDQFERQVMTELDGTVRLSRETWRLASAD